MSGVVGGWRWRGYGNAGGAVFSGIRRFDIFFAVDMSIKKIDTHQLVHPSEYLE